MIPIRFGAQVCGHLDEGGQREWLLPDGLGGFAMGTVSGLRTRRYHGLLMVSGDTPAARCLAVADLDPSVTLRSGARVALGTHEWADGTIHPRGFELLESFELVDGLPRWRWRAGEVVLERELALLRGRPYVAVRHRLLSGGPVTLSLDALVTWRDGHGERYASGPPLDQHEVADGVVFGPGVRLWGPGWRTAGGWWLGTRYREEAARGLAPVEDLWHAGSFTATLDEAGQTLDVAAWAGDPSAEPVSVGEVIEAARGRNRQVITAAAPQDDIGATLALAADAFIVRTRNGPDVVAGYPWFGTWSRDTMTSYEGLFLETGRADEGRALLRAYAATLSQGMLANTADTGRTEYNTVDATLWMLHAIDRHVTRTGDFDLGAELLPSLLGVVDHHVAGTRYGIVVDPSDGLITQGAASPTWPGDPDKPYTEALTWMDARIDGVAVTPRAGKPVEVNALWVNGLTAIERLATVLGADPGPVPALAATALRSFRLRFPAPSVGWLHDLVDGLTGDDSSLRPNQLLAWSLPYAPMQPDPRALRLIGAALLTPLGPRSLAPGSAGYTGLHRGGPAERDRAYHQGTVWPWLLGPYVDAVRKNSPQGRTELADAALAAATRSTDTTGSTGAGTAAPTGAPLIHSDGTDDSTARHPVTYNDGADLRGNGKSDPNDSDTLSQTDIRNVTATIRNGSGVHVLFSGIEAHLTEFGLGSVSETADGQAPHAATGCPFQAWSVAEVLRVRRF